MPCCKGRAWARAMRGASCAEWSPPRRGRVNVVSLARANRSPSVQGRIYTPTLWIGHGGFGWLGHALSVCTVCAVCLRLYFLL